MTFLPTLMYAGLIRDNQNIAAERATKVVTLYRSGGLEGTVVYEDAPEVAYCFDGIAVLNGLPPLRSNSVYFVSNVADARHWCSQRIHYGGDPTVYRVEIDTATYTYSVSAYNKYAKAYNLFQRAVTAGRHAEIDTHYEEMVRCVKLYHGSRTLLTAGSSDTAEQREVLIHRSIASQISDWQVEYEPVLY